MISGAFSDSLVVVVVAVVAVVRVVTMNECSQYDVNTVQGASVGFEVVKCSGRLNRSTE